MIKFDPAHVLAKAQARIAALNALNADLLSLPTTIEGLKANITWLTCLAEHIHSFDDELKQCVGYDFIHALREVTGGLERFLSSHHKYLETLTKET